MMKPRTDLDLLRSIPPGHLYAIAEARRLPLARPTNNPPDPPALEEMARRLFHEPSLREATRGLSQPQWAILRELASAGGQVPSSDLRLYLTAAGYIPGAGRAPGAQDRLYELALARLLGLGLVFWGRLDSLGGRDYASGAHEGLLVLPPSVLALLATIEPPPEAEAPPNRPQPRAPRPASVPTLQRDLYLYWRVVHEQPTGFQLTTQGLLSKTALRLLNAALSLKSDVESARSEQEAPRLLFVRLLAQAVGLLLVQDGTLRAAKAQPFFALPLIERARRCFLGWRDGAFWNESLFLPGISLRPPPAPLTPARREVLHARQAALALLGTQLVGEWISRLAFLTLADLRQPHRLFSPRSGQPSQPPSAENSFGWEFHPRGGWFSPHQARAQVEAAFLAAVVEGPLHWLGLVDLDYSAADQPIAYRPSAAAPGLLEAGEWPPMLQEEPPGRLLIQPNFDLVALAPLRETTLLFLDDLAERQSLEQVAQYRLTRPRWLRALQQASSATLIEQLETLAQTTLPQNVAYSLLDWERQAQRLRLHPSVALLEVQDAAALDALLAEPTLAPLIRRRLTPTAALVDRARLAQLYAALLERGDLPRLHFS